MTSAELAAWRAEMGFSQAAAARALGVTLATYQSLERGATWATGRAKSIDRRTALACAAILAGLAPLGGPTSDTAASP